MRKNVSKILVLTLVQNLFLPISNGYAANVTSAAEASLNDAFNRASNGSVIPKPGDKMDWSGGLLERTEDGKFKFTSGNYTQILSDPSDMAILAKNNAQVNINLINSFGIDLNRSPDESSKFNDNFYNLTHTPGNKNGSAEFGLNGSGQGSLKVNYDESGSAKSITTSNGETLSVDEFKRSNLYSALSGNFANDIRV